MTISLTQLTDEIKAFLQLEKDSFKESQVIRMRSIEQARQVGERLVTCRELLKEATRNNPVLSDVGTFSSFKEFYESQGFSKRTVYRYIKLAENWDIVIKLGMQDTTNPQNLKHCMRLVRTVHVIDWYLDKLEAGAAEESLTMEQYWLDNSPDNTGPTKRQLSELVEALQEQVAMQSARIAQQSKELEEVKGEKQKLTLDNLKLRSAALQKPSGSLVEPIEA